VENASGIRLLQRPLPPHLFWVGDQGPVNLHPVTGLQDLLLIGFMAKYSDIIQIQLKTFKFFRQPG